MKKSRKKRSQAKVHGKSSAPAVAIATAPLAIDPTVEDAAMEHAFFERGLSEEMPAIETPHAWTGLAAPPHADRRLRILVGAGLALLVGLALAVARPWSERRSHPHADTTNAAHASEA